MDTTTDHFTPLALRVRGKKCDSIAFLEVPIPKCISNESFMNTVIKSFSYEAGSLFSKVSHFTKRAQYSYQWGWEFRVAPLFFLLGMAVVCLEEKKKTKAAAKSPSNNCNTFPCVLCSTLYHQMAEVHCHCNTAKSVPKKWGVTVTLLRVFPR